MPTGSSPARGRMGDGRSLAFGSAIARVAPPTNVCLPFFLGLSPRRYGVRGYGAELRRSDHVPSSWAALIGDAMTI